MVSKTPPRFISEKMATKTMILAPTYEMNWLSIDEECFVLVALLAPSRKTCLNWPWFFQGNSIFSNDLMTSTRPYRVPHKQKR
jgi:hypothetical protein